LRRPLSFTSEIPFGHFLSFSPKSSVGPREFRHPSIRLLAKNSFFVPLMRRDQRPGSVTAVCSSAFDFFSLPFIGEPASTGRKSGSRTTIPGTETPEYSIGTYVWQMEAVVPFLRTRSGPLLPPNPIHYVTQGTVRRRLNALPEIYIA